jgi:uncharacterized phage protein (TIGR01671 family)
MSRVIKFRAWDETRSRMIQPDELGNSAASLTLPDGTKRIMPIITFAMIAPHAGFTLEQFTGLLDREGKEIYEGDIIAVVYRDLIRGEVIWSPEYLTYLIKRHYGSEYMSDYLADAQNQGAPITVIGNVHQHPHLLQS